MDTGEIARALHNIADDITETMVQIQSIKDKHAHASALFVKAQEETRGVSEDHSLAKSLMHATTVADSLSQAVVLIDEATDLARTVCTVQVECMEKLVGFDVQSDNLHNAARILQINTAYLGVLMEPSDGSFDIHTGHAVEMEPNTAHAIEWVRDTAESFGQIG